VNLLDLIIVVVAISAIVGGYRLGFLARAASWAGLVIGLILGARFLPQVVDALRNTTPSNRLLIAVAILVGAAFLGQALGLLAGAAVQRVIPLGPLRTADRVAGAVAGAVGVSVALWLMIPAMADVPGWWAREARHSRIARAIDTFPVRPPDALQAFRRLVGDANFPRVFDALRPAPDVGPPPADSGLTAAVISRVTRSTVRVEGQACRRIQDGSGFAVGPDTVVTNAHVVAGERQTQVFTADRRRLRAVVVVFDSDRDLAVLRVTDLRAPPLPIGVGKEGERGAVFGHPGGQTEVAVSPAGIIQRIVAVGRDLYDRHETRRQVFILAANLQPGDSGGPLVDATGTVVGVAFAIAPDRPGTAYALTTDELRPVLARPQAAPADTGSCLNAA
jgi:S1-C subfamily serine protease